MGSCSAYSSDDVILEILSKLPVKSILRFRCICKPWYTFLIDPDFIAMHIKKYDADEVRLVVEYMDTFANIKYAFFADQTLTDLSYHDMESHIPSLGQLIGPYDGLFCLYAKEYDCVTIWNPATRESRILPEARTILPPNTSISYCCVALGMDCLTNEHKLALMLTLWDDEKSLFYLFPHLMLYNLSTDSWRSFEVVGLDHYRMLKRTSDGVYLDGICYWLAFQGRDQQVIISYDLGKEMFHEIKSPCIPYSKRGTMGLCNESLSLLLLDRLENCFEIWIMKKSCWAKRLKVGPLLGVREPLGFWKEEAIFIESNMGQLLLYDTCTHELKDVGLTTLGIEVHNYKESLMWVK